MNYTLQSSLLGGDLLNPNFLLGLIDDSGEFVPFHLDDRTNAAADLSGVMTLQAGHPYDFVLFDRINGHYYHSSDSVAETAFDPLLRYHTSNAVAYDQTLTGDYFGAASLAFRLSTSADPSVLISFGTQRLQDDVFGDGFIDPFQTSVNEFAARQNVVPEPSAATILSLLSGSVLIWKTRHRKARLRVR